jgi:pimeloyl-ACP methyl ester carboxylesterase
VSVSKARINGCVIHYEQVGSGRDLVFIHGLLGNMTFWSCSLLPELMKDFRVCLYDLRGHGLSEAQNSGYTSSNMAEDLRGLLQYLGIGQAHLVGYSFGGAVALHCAARYPEEIPSLTLVDAWIPCFQQPFPLRDAFLAKLRRLEARSATSSRRIRQWITLTNATRAWAEIFETGDLTAEKLKQVAQPVHAIYGQYSHCLPSLLGVQRTLPRCQAEIVPGLGHFYPRRSPRVLLDNLKHLATDRSS